MGRKIAFIVVFIILPIIIIAAKIDKDKRARERSEKESKLISEIKQLNGYEESEVVR
jgi:hypothetical protein